MIRVAVWTALFVSGLISAAVLLGIFAILGLLT